MAPNKGATLIEMIVVGALLALVMGVIVFMLGTSSKQSLKSDRVQASHHTAHTFLAALREDLRSAVKFSSSNNELILTLPFLHPQGISIDYQSIIYQWSDNTITRMSDSKTKSKRVFKLQPREEGTMQMSISQHSPKTALCELKVINIDNTEVVNIREVISMDGVESTPR